jgi:hypothetical protein
MDAFSQSGFPPRRFFDTKPCASLHLRMMDTKSGVVQNLPAFGLHGDTAMSLVQLA